MKSIAKGISVSYVSYPGLITPEVPEFADLERGVRFTFDVKSYYKEDSDNIYARIKEVGGS
ncbi:MAG: hypothetical protein MJ219_03770 [Mycoplasmoidaceae bacterium]|nr:hypothetical protein [Mycoplasmoidaceae bacterium]